MNIEEVNRCLRQFDGGYGRLVKYSDGMEALRLEIALDHRRCEVLCKGCRYIGSPTVWSGSRLEVVRLEEEVVELRARGGEARIRCWVVTCEVFEEEGT